MIAKVKSLCLVLGLALMAAGTLQAQELPSTDRAPFPAERFDGVLSVELSEFPPSRFLKRAITRGPGFNRNNVTLGELTGSPVQGGTARWVLQVGEMPGLEVARLGKPLEVTMVLSGPGRLREVVVSDFEQNRGLREAFRNAFGAFVAAGTQFAIGDPYYETSATFLAGGLSIPMTVVSVVDGAVTVDGRKALAVRYAAEGRVEETDGWIGLTISGFHYIDLATSAIRRSAENTVTQGLSNGASFLVRQFSESVVELPAVSPI